MHNIPNEDLYDAQRWAEQAAADEEAEITYRRMMEDEEAMAERAADEVQAEAQADAEPTIIDHDIF